MSSKCCSRQDVGASRSIVSVNAQHEILPLEEGSRAPERGPRVGAPALQFRSECRVQEKNLSQIQSASK
jgi:hypothetical protein